MKYIIYGIVGCALLVLSVVMVLTVEGRVDREHTLREAVTLAVDATMKETWEKGQENVDEAKWQKQFCARLKKQLEGMKTSGDIQVEIYGVDIEKGLLSVRVTETFLHPNGKKGTCSVTQTAVIDQKKEKENCTVSFFADGKLWQAYEVTEGSSFLLPDTPVKQGQTFVGWSMMEKEWKEADFPKDVVMTQNYYAFFK